MGVKDDFSVSKYTSSTIKEQTEKIKTLMSDMDRVKRIVNGVEDVPNDIKSGALLKSVQNYAIATKDGDLLKSIARGPLGSKLSEAGSELSLARGESDSPVTALKDVTKQRVDDFEKTTGKSVTKEVKSTISDIQSKIPTHTKDTISKFIDDNICK